MKTDFTKTELKDFDKLPKSSLAFIAPEIFEELDKAGVNTFTGKAHSHSGIRQFTNGNKARAININIADKGLVTILADVDETVYENDGVVLVFRENRTSPRNTVYSVFDRVMELEKRV